MSVLNFIQARKKSNAKSRTDSASTVEVNHLDLLDVFLYGQILSFVRFTNIFAHRLVPEVFFFETEVFLL